MFSSGPGRREERSRLRRQSSADQVAARIRRAIITGELRPGERLRQDDIADEFGVSRIPVREALIALDGEGWVRLESNRGARVTGLEKRDIADHYELRGLVFGLVASRAAELAKPDDCKELTRLLRTLGEAKDLAQFEAANDLILRFLVKLTGSARLRAALRVTPSIIPENFFEIVPGAREVQAAGLASVIRAIKAGDPDRADRGMRSTLRRLGEAVAQAFTANGVLTGG
jgi:DNA-binding GntR family transcriptional regulator